MKNVLLMLALVLTGAASAMAFQTVTVSGSITSNTTWTNDKQYLLSGYVYVESGATLTINAGTIIRGDKATKGALIIERGAKIMAQGTASEPIVFTSNQKAGSRNYGDWGGVILCGKAPTNWSAEPTVEGGPRSKYGGTDPHDNSGILSYVRIEFPGIAFSPNNEVNGLTFCGVGDATQVDHVQVSYSFDDSYEWFGGSVNGKYLISHRTWDDDFDTDNGYNGKNQFVVGIRDNIADQSGSKAFESDSYQPGGVTATGLAGDTSMITKPVFSNVTIVGPIVNPATPNFDPNFTAAVHIRRGSALSILNSVIFGFPAGLLMDESAASMGSTTANIASGILQFKYNMIGGSPTTSTNAPGGAKDIVYVKDGARSLTPTNTNADTLTNNPFSPFAGPYSYLLAAANGNKTYATTQAGIKLTNPFTLTNPDLHPQSTSPIAYNTVGNGSAKFFDPTKPLNYDTTNGYANYNVPQFAPNFTTTKAADGFFSKVNHIGAFSGDVNSNWFAGWTNFDPVNADYDSKSSAGSGATAVGNVSNTLQAARIYPNPAVNGATVVFDLNQGSAVSINLVDITGKVISKIHTGDEAKGIHTAFADLSAVNPGIYFVKITTATGTKSVKLSIVK